ncbi:hypothetical protein ACJMK2_040192 [Sinanodonta woodiana]|uniref:RING-type domain-containing protein n=1 Tax=Sinanodonta woodiana TaxID=1069815 RepID=A0ABD3WGW8_SINWO
MTQSIRNVKNIAEHFRCPIHLGHLKDPRKLSCDHSFCSECLDRVIKIALTDRVDGIFDCPVCRTRHHIPDVPDNWSREFPVDAFSVLQLHTIEQYQRTTMCNMHIGKFKEYFCFHHREILCADCVIENHTKDPCSCGTLQDSLMEVKLQIKELLGQLNQQEERIRRILDSKMANAHAEELIRQIVEVEKQFTRFSKAVKAKLKEAKQEVAEATKMPASELEHLTTTKTLIAKTRSHVEDALRTKSNDSYNGTGDILSLWTPLEKEVNNFENSLNAIELKPFPISAEVNEQFFNFIAFEQLPVIIKRDDRTYSSVSPRRLTYIKADTKVRTSTINDGSVSPKRSRPSSKSIKKDEQSQIYSGSISKEPSRPVTQGIGVQHPISPTLKTVRKSVTHSVLSSPNKNRNSSRVVIGDLTIRDTSKSITDLQQHLKGLEQLTSFELSCSDLVISNSHIIMINESTIQKFTLENEFVQGIALKCPWRLCAIKESSNVIVNHNIRFLTVIATAPTLSILYRIETEKPYSAICHMGTSALEDRFGRITYQDQFSLTHTTDLMVDCIDLITIKHEYNPHSNFIPLNAQKIRPTKVKTIISSNTKQMVRGPNAMASTSDGKRLIIGAESAIVCIKKSGDVLWTRPITRCVSSISADKGLLFLCFEAESKISIVDESGNMLQENILPLSCTIVRPNRVSVDRNVMVVREFNNVDWKSFLHLFQLIFSSNRLIGSHHDT